jgi:hypothetical protein
MDIKKLRRAVEVLKEDLGSALIAGEIFSAHDGQGVMCLVGSESRPVANALMNRITAMIIDSLKEAGFPGMGKFWQIEMDGGRLSTNIPMGDYVWGMLVDTNKVQVGLLNNVVIPKIIQLVKEAEKG